MTLYMLFIYGKYNSSLCFFCITAASAKSMTVLWKLIDTEFDFRLNFYT